MDNIQTKIHERIHQGLKLLAELQLEDGGFDSLSSNLEHDFLNAKKYRTTFPASLILSCLSSLPSSDFKNLIAQRAVTFFMSQKSEHWSYNYFVRHSEVSKKLPFPDDLDDTFCALSGLALTDKKTFDGTALAKIAQILTSFEKQEGGPYKTWLVNESADQAWKDVDLAVNCNIAYFLHLQDIRLDGLDEFITQNLNQQVFNSPYYSSEFPVLYFIARSFPHSPRKLALEKLRSLRKTDGTWGNSLDTAFAITASLRLDEDPQTLLPAIESLITHPLENLNKSYSFGVDPALKGERHFSGASSVTLAFCLEALALYATALNFKNTSGNKVADNTKVASIRRQIIDSVRSSLENYKRPCSTCINGLIDRVLIMDDINHVSTLPALFANSLLDNLSEKISTPDLVILGTANIFGWSAYTAYDDILDGDSGAELLPFANILHRKMVFALEKLFPITHNFHKTWSSVLDGMDRANAWELLFARCKIKDQTLQILEELPVFNGAESISLKSMGHAFSAAGVLQLAGFHSDTPEFKDLWQFFTFSLAARQLNDDAHDWEKDFLKGRLTLANTPALAIWKSQHNKKTFSFTDDLNDLRWIYWHDIMPQVCSTILLFVSQARTFEQKLTHIINPEFLDSLLLTSEKSAKKADSEREDILKFLNTYQSKL